MMQIKLTKGMVALVDDADYEGLNGFKWHASKSAYNFYAARFEGRHKIYMHRQIMDCDNGKVVNHKDTDSLNNQRENLEACTQKANLRKRKFYRKGKR